MRLTLVNKESRAILKKEFVEYPELLLDDETTLSSEEYERRLSFSAVLRECVPREVLENLSVFQPSAGCLNLCRFCSQESGALLQYLDGASVRTLAGGMKAAMLHWGVPFVSCNRDYKPGILFPYLDSDVGVYPYLVDYLIAVSSLGVKTRISTVGWPRSNQTLNDMHKKIVNDYCSLLGNVRFSLTPYAVGFKADPEEFVLDFASALSIYKPLLGLKGLTGACIDVCLPPDILAGQLEIRHTAAHSTWLSCGEYSVAVCAPDLQAPAEATLFIGAVGDIGQAQIEEFAQGGGSGLRPELHAEHGRFYPLSNADGLYYAFIPDSGKSHTDGVFFYPKTGTREGGLLDARWPLRAFRDDAGIPTGQGDNSALYEQLCQIHIEKTERHSTRRAKYLRLHLQPLIHTLCQIFALAGIDSGLIFDPTVVFDRGIIRNSGRAYGEFRKIASGKNITVVPDSTPNQKTRREVWRVFPVQAVHNRNLHGLYGLKSRPSSDVDLNLNQEPVLAVLAVDPLSHSNTYKDGMQRRAIYIPIGKYVRPLKTITFPAGKNEGLIPGLGSKYARTDDE